MVATIQSFLADVPWLTVLAFLIDITIKGAIICSLAAIATLLLRRSSAFLRSTVWICAVAGLLLLPAFSLQTPVLQLSILPHVASWGQGSYESGADKNGGEAPVASSTAAVDAPAAMGGAGAATPIGIPWYAWGIVLWVTGGVLYFGWYIVSRVGVQSIVRQARPADDEWTRLLDQVSNELELRRGVRLLESDRLKAAIAVGIFDPVVVLPTDCEDWSASRRRLVLSHELAHVKRWDTLTEMFALFATAFYWFNPLVLFAVRRMRIERETDCDNAVLQTGAKPSDYAELLLTIAADLSASPKPAWHLTAISQGSNVKDRLMDILNKKANHKSGSRRSVFLTGLLALALLLPISTASLWTDASSQTKEKSKEMKAKEHAEKQAKWDAMSDAEKEDYEATENAEWDALSDEEKEARKAEKKAEWDAMSAEDKSAWMWDKVCYADNSAACVVGKTMKAHGVEAGLTEYASLKAAEEGKYAFKEKAFNNLGYAFLYVEKIDAAIAVLKINNDAFPDSWNTYDSLAEVYTLANQYKKAIKLYEVAVKMNPEGEHSKAQLDKLLTMVAEN